MAETLADVAMKIRAPNAVIGAPRIRARHGQRSAGRLKAPLRAAHEPTRGVRFIKLQAMNMLSPEAMRAAEVFFEHADHGAERVHHETASDQTRRIRQAG